MKVKSFILPSILAVIIIFHFVIPFRLNLVSILKNPLSFFSSIKVSIQTYNNLLAENKKLKEQNVLFIKNQILLEDFKRENAEFKKIFDFKQSSKLKLKPAKIIARDITGFLTTIIIDKGQKAGVQKGMAVINHIGLVGKVSDASQDTAQVILITDSNLSVSAIAARSRSQGIVCGGIGGYLVMKYVDDENITCGDKILTSNLSQFFPQGILIGDVVRVEKDIFNKDIFIIIKPAVDLNKLETVLVVLDK